MSDSKVLNYLKEVLENMPTDWLTKTTHRLDLYDEKSAKVKFLEDLEGLYESGNSDTPELSELPTAFDYIRLGHPLSCLLEWAVARLNSLDSKNVLSFSSKTMPLLAILRTNLLDNKKTQIAYDGELPESFDEQVLKNVYGYKFDLVKVARAEEIPKFEGSTIYVSSYNSQSSAQQTDFGKIELTPNVDFFISLHADFGSLCVVSGKNQDYYTAAIQHVRRRETVAMTPPNCLDALNSFVDRPAGRNQRNVQADHRSVLGSIKKITGAGSKALLSSSGLSMQYAILMGVIDDALEKHKGKDIKIIVPPNCYGGTNDQARRVAACLENVEVVDLLVDGDNEMVQSIETILSEVAHEDAVPFIIAEIPTNPRVEVPDLRKLKDALTKERKTRSGSVAVDPVFILDQTFCPNVHFLGEGDVLSTVRTVSYVSGSKFPSGGLCTAGYCASSKNADALMSKIETHLKLCDNEATGFQVEILSKQLPSMNQRIEDAYKNTRTFVDFIAETLPEAKINFVSEELAQEGFTPSVFSLDLPEKGKTPEEREKSKRGLNYKLINMMIERIPTESKHCVSYGQLQGCYWTIPATSTQGTTKEGDKDYIVRVALAPNMDVELHKKVFLDFTQEI